MDKKNLPKYPLSKIALSFSGGGYRATAFHLGSISYLDRLHYFGKPLLENVEMLSTVSGGTITGIVYALGIQEGRSFLEIYTELRNKLSSLDLLKTGFSMLDSNFKWPNEYKSKNLINAFALQYDAEFTNGRNLGDLTRTDTHLKQIVFNSTEFTNAINFRFKSDANQLSGNFYIEVPAKFQPYIKLSDIMASSSCFPGGFEPMLWPADFKYASISNHEIFKTPKVVTGLMDGGIYDNQGIESILNFQKKKKPYFDLVIISDVASPYMNPFRPANITISQKGPKALTLRKLYEEFQKKDKILSLSIMLMIGLCTIYPIYYKFPNTIWTGVCITLFIFLLCFSFVKWFLVRSVTSKIKHFSESMRNTQFKFYFEKLSLLRIEELSLQMIEPLFLNRVNSLISLLMDVFLKVTRRLNYDKLYEDETYKYRRISNLVRELTEYDFRNRLTRDDQKVTTRSHQGNVTGEYNEVVGEKIKQIAESASGFGTTLWFTEEELLEKMQDKLLATGQFTMCYNLIVYFEKLIFTTDSGFSELENNIKQEIMLLYESCLNDWKRFKEDPIIMVDNLKF